MARLAQNVRCFALANSSKEHLACSQRYSYQLALGTRRMIKAEQVEWQNLSKHANKAFINCKWRTERSEVDAHQASRFLIVVPVVRRQAVFSLS